MSKTQFIKFLIDLHKKGSLYMTDDGLREFVKLMQQAETEAVSEAG